MFPPCAAWIDPDGPSKTKPNPTASTATPKADGLGAAGRRSPSDGQTMATDTIRSPSATKGAGTGGSVAADAALTRSMRLLARARRTATRLSALSEGMERLTQLAAQDVPAARAAHLRRRQGQSVLGHAMLVVTVQMARTSGLWPQELVAPDSLRIETAGVAGLGESAVSGMLASLLAACGVVVTAAEAGAGTAGSVSVSQGMVSSRGKGGPIPAPGGPGTRTGSSSNSNSSSRRSNGRKGDRHRLEVATASACGAPTVLDAKVASPLMLLLGSGLSSSCHAVCSRLAGGGAAAISAGGDAELGGLVVEASAAVDARPFGGRMLHAHQRAPPGIVDNVCGSGVLALATALAATLLPRGVLAPSNILSATDTNHRRSGHGVAHNVIAASRSTSASALAGRVSHRVSGCRSGPGRGDRAEPSK